MGTPAIVLNKTAQQLASKSYRDIWKTIKKLKGSERLTAIVIDDNYTDETIVNNFCTIYSTLYISVCAFGTNTPVGLLTNLDSGM